MALVHHQQEKSLDWHLIGLVLVVFGMIALSIPCVKLAVDQFFSLIW